MGSGPKMPYDSRRTSYSSSRSASTTSTSSNVSRSSISSETDVRKQSLREMPSYRDLLDADHASKPWLKFRSVSQKSLDLEQVKEDSGQAYPVNLDHQEVRQKSSSSVFSQNNSSQIIAPSVVLSARPVKYSRSDPFY